MSTTIHLTPRSEELLEEQMARGDYRSPEEVIETALENLAGKDVIRPLPSTPSKKSPTEAVADILEIQKRNRLNGLKIKDLIREGHRY
jgi:Arc/MetJ-type ribon-helix-helix transcriptional regulator